MARKIAHFGNVTVLNPRRSFVETQGWGAPVTNAGVYFHKLSHQAEGLVIRLTEMWRAGGDSVIKEARALVPVKVREGETPVVVEILEGSTATRAGTALYAALRRAERRDHSWKLVQAAEVRMRGNAVVAKIAAMDSATVEAAAF